MQTILTRARLWTAAAVVTGVVASAAAITLTGAAAEPEPLSVRAAAVGDVRPAPAPDGGIRASQRALTGAMQKRQQRAAGLQVLDLTPPEPEPEIVTAAEADPEPAPASPSRTDVWYALAQCESGGNWQETAGTFEGGLQFHPGTWDAYKPAGYPGAAYEATPAQQIAVAEMVLADQGWGAWPACSRELGLR